MTGNTGTNKITGLSEAVKAHIRQGMILHAPLLGGPGATISEIIRQFYGRGPGFTLVMNITAGHGTNLIHCGLVKKLIAATCVELLPNFRPNAVVQRAYKTGALALEAWSFGSIEQRLMAGAMGVPFMPTRSLLGSSAAEDNADSFMEMADPFGSGRRVGVVKALNPDISIIHGLASDESGNTILGVPYMDALWGARAAREGVIVTTERIVSEDFIRAHSNSVKLPGYLVKTVSVAPFGLHPYSFSGHGIGEMEGYESDGEFAAVHSRAAAKAESLDKWLNEWVLSVPDHESYLQKLGAGRLNSLTEKAREAEKTAPSAPPLTDASGQDSPTQEEIMIVIAARELRDIIQKKHLSVVFTGAGVVLRTCALARRLLKDEGYQVDLVGGAGLYGYNPVLSDLSMANLGYVSGCKMLTDSSEVYGVITQGETSRCVTVLGGGQIDRHGDINTTKTAEGGWIVGSGGGNDAAGALEVMVVMRQSRERLVEKVAYVSSSGRNVRTLVTDLGIFTKPNGTDEFVLSGYFQAHAGEDGAAALGRIQQECGWKITTSSRLAATDPPSVRELAVFRSLR